MYLGLFLALILLLVVALLWMPIVVCLDTRSNSYYVRLKGLAKASLEADKEEWIRIHLRVFWMHFYFHPLRKRVAQKNSEEGQKKKRKGRSRVPKMRTLLRLARSFSIKKFRIDIDTGDSVLNAKLYPLYAVLFLTKLDLGINFEGRNELALVIENRPIRIITSFINF